MARTEIVGRDDESFVGDFLSTATKGFKKSLTLPVDVLEWALRHSPGPSDLLGEEEMELAREGGAAERGAAVRRMSSSGYNGHWKYMRGEETEDQKRQAALGAVVKPALKSKRISRSDLDKAALASTGSKAPASKVSAAREQIASFLTRHGVKVTS
jgi:hypothetical protein